MKRTFDILLSTSVLAIALPVLVFAAVGVKLSSPGPIFYRARRVGLNNREFIMFKFRTMHVNEGGPVITSQSDRRIFGFGNILRILKIDEIPQFINVLRGDMAIVGPRPEDPKIVSRDYVGWMRETLWVKPGITSPGALFYSAWGERLVDPADPERSYAERLLPAKLAVDRAYMERATILGDISVTFLTVLAIVGQAFGKRIKPSRLDIDGARRWAPSGALKDFA
jgi:lipopolysaccharide/colanic/teichoic acid biosynthesis glycosyltransferase